MAQEVENPHALIASLGLCALCRYRRAQPSARGSVFHRCALADEDEGYLRYPPLPMRHCRGFEELGSG